MAGPPLSAETERRLHLCFPPELREGASRLLVEHCGNNLPFCNDCDAGQMERIRFAALKLSEGDMAKLSEAVRIAQIDWRDVLVAAGFGSELRADQNWLSG